MLSTNFSWMLIMYSSAVRGFVTGSTDTSLWTVYKKGVRNYCGNILPNGVFCNWWVDSLMLSFIIIISIIYFFAPLHYSLCQHVIGMVKNQRLAANILTPTTKAVDHDVPVTPDEVFSSFSFRLSIWSFIYVLILFYLLSLWWICCLLKLPLQCLPKKFVAWQFLGKEEEEWVKRGSNEVIPLMKWIMDIFL